jgi:CubicO group peptidase (beta-lactamase class C family)
MGTIDPVLLARADRLAAAEIAARGVPGIAIGLTDLDGQTVVRTYGLANVEAAAPVEPDTLFEIGSIGKTFTAIVMLQLAEEGRLDLNAPVAAVLPWFEMPIVGRPVTIHDLLTHAAGITSGIDGTPEAAFQVHALRDRMPASAPGERFHYSNVGFKILGLVIEALEGLPYPEVVRRRVLERLGMTATEPAISNAMRPRLAVGYAYEADDRIGHLGHPLAPATWLETATADGSIASTAGDMAKLARMLLRRGGGPGARLLSEASFALLAGPHTRPSPDFGYGYGLMTRTLDGRTFIGHTGGMIGFVAGLQVEPASGLGVVVLMNAICGAPMMMGRAILGVEPAGVDDDAEATDALNRVGTYLPDPAANLQPLEIMAKGTGLVLRSGDADVALEALGDGRYLAPDVAWDRFALQFTPAEGRPTAIWQGGDRYVRDGADVPPDGSPDPSVAAIAGHYRSHNPWTSNFWVIVRGAVPWLVFAAAPDGFEDEQPLLARPDGSYAAGEDPRTPEDLRFDTIVDGRPLRAWLSGSPYYRVD